MKTTHPTPKPPYTGTVDHVSKQYAYIVVPGLSADLLVTHPNLQGAWHGDTVHVTPLHGKKRNGKPEGKVVAIVKRAQTQFIGQIQAQGEDYFLLPDHKRHHHPILLPPAQAREQVDHKAVASITRWPQGRALAQGTLDKVLGPAGNHHAETEAIILQFGFSSSFAPNLLEAANRFPDKLSQEEINARRDMRSTLTLTIDPKDAQDFDDALSLQTLPNGHYEIGIHIADVSHYVKPQSPIDEEALARGTSVYLVGETIPMLPERLSNNLCSLKPHEDRPAFSLVVEMDRNARVHKTWLGETVIHSDHRFTYDEAKEAIEQTGHALHAPLRTLHEIAQKLREKRLAHGAIPFNTTDFNIHLDEAGEPILITPKQSSIAHHLIEEFMLLANRTVATQVYDLKKPKQPAPPFIYRAHDEPDPDKLEQLSRFARQLGYTFKPKKGQLPQAYQHLLGAIEGTAHQHILQSLAIRTMAQACYTTQPKPHFGLAFDHYTHFTSPIRRYPDLIVHRLLKKYFAHGSAATTTDAPSYQEVATHTSQRERLAIDAERASINYKQVVFMQKLQGQTLQGTIAHITQWGIYVEITDNKCEGMVRLSDIKGDYYLFEPEKFRLRGKRTGKVYQLGDTVQVQIKACNIDKRTVDLIFV